jgi:hypothetical protein
MMATLSTLASLGCSPADEADPWLREVRPSTEQSNSNGSGTACTDQVTRITTVPGSESITARFSDEKIVVAWAEVLSTPTRANVMLAQYTHEGAVDIEPGFVFDMDVSDWPWPGTYFHVSLGVSGSDLLVASNTRAENRTLSSNVQVHSVVQARGYDRSLSPLCLKKTLSDTVWHSSVISAYHPQVFPLDHGFRVVWYDWRTEEPSGYGQIYHAFGLYHSDLTANGTVSDFDNQITQEWAAQSRGRRVDSDSAKTTWISGSDDDRATIWVSNRWSQIETMQANVAQSLRYLDTMTDGAEQWVVVIEGENLVQLASAGSGWAATTVADSGTRHAAGTRLVSTVDGVFVVWAEHHDHKIKRFGIAAAENPSRQRTTKADLDGSFTDIQDVRFSDGAVEMITSSEDSTGSTIDLVRICLPPE